ncbi:MAG: mandelate racemase/muconate lactonizing enzyme family protein [Hyphomicrobiales bacterium]|nr:mandelate racemase/muconate lactonizing enzyme family protein [Hyphomicrobiales bacterium]
MKITAVETIQVEEFSNFVWVRIETDEGLVGTGETVRNPNATASYVHETCAPYLLGQSPLDVERHAHALMETVGNRFAGYPTRSIELRGNSAVDLALWDLFGKALGQPVWQLLGGLCREKVRIYNTCASADYNRIARGSTNSRSVQHGSVTKSDFTVFEDLEAQMAAPEDLARSLLEEGITGMKIWPFDVFAMASGGHHIALADLRTGVSIVERIRGAVGDKMDIMMEYHGLWRLPQITQIARALDEYDVYWHEDPVPMHRFDDLQRFKQATTSRVTGSENLGTKTWYIEAFERGTIDVAHFDLCWIGGLTEGRKIAAIAEAYERPIAPHDCVGPITLAASTHLVCASRNGLLQETVRAFTRGYYRDITTDLPAIENGFISPTRSPGMGLELLPDFAQRADATVRRSTA